MVKKLRVVPEGRKGDGGGAAPPEKRHPAEAKPPKKPRKRGKRPGAPRTAKMKRERRQKAGGDDDEEDDDDDAAGQPGEPGAADKEEETRRKRQQASKGAPRDAEAEEQPKKKRKGKGAADVAEHFEEESDEDNYLDFRLHVRGLPEAIEEKNLRKLFGKFGDIKRIRLLMDKKKQFRGSAFVTFRGAEALEKALDLDKSEYKGKEIAVKKAAPPVEGKTPTEKQAEDLQIFAGGLPFNTEEAVVRRDFSECGKISRLRMLRDPKSKKFKGAVFITYKTQAGVDAALKFDGTDYGGRQLTVRLAGPKEGRG